MRYGLWVFSGFLTEIDGPGPWADQLANSLRNQPAMKPHTLDLVKKPYSVLPGSLQEFLDLAEQYDRIFILGHSFGGAAVKWLMDHFLNAGIVGKVVLVALLDPVPNFDRFGEWFPSWQGDWFPAKRWGIPEDVSPAAFAVYQRNDEPQGTQIREIDPPAGLVIPHHWNRSVFELGTPRCGHIEMHSDPKVLTYVVNEMADAVED